MKRKPYIFLGLSRAKARFLKDAMRFCMAQAIMPWNVEDAEEILESILNSERLRERKKRQ